MSIENNSQKKLLLTSGCSFTDTLDSWPNHLSKKLNFNLDNIAFASQGNGLISRKLIYKINQIPKSILNQNDIIVGVMWSGIDRAERFIDSKGDQYFVTNLSKPENVTSVVPGYRNWRLMIPDWVKYEDCKLHYEVFNNKISSKIYTIEHILRTQWFLEKHNIKYFMSTYMDIFKDKNNSNEYPDVKYLYNMIDFSKFLPINGCFEWVKEHYPKEFRGINKNGDITDFHPTNFGQEKFTDEVIIPYLKEKNLIHN
jgi:hypothetical protein